MRKKKTGPRVWAVDYHEIVTILKIEKKPTEDDNGRFTIQRDNGGITMNYPGYLLDLPEVFR